MMPDDRQAIHQGAHDNDPVEDLERKAAATLAAATELLRAQSGATRLPPRIHELHRNRLQRLPPPTPIANTASSLQPLPTVRQLRDEARAFKREGRQRERITGAVLKEAKKLPDRAKTDEWLRTRTAHLTAAANTPAELERSLRALRSGDRISITRTASGTTVEVPHPQDADLTVQHHTPRFPKTPNHTTSTLTDITGANVHPPAAPGTHLNPPGTKANNPNKTTEPTERERA